MSSGCGQSQGYISKNICEIMTSTTLHYAETGTPGATLRSGGTVAQQVRFVHFGVAWPAWLTDGGII